MIAKVLNPTSWKQPMTDVEAARYVAHTHRLYQQSDEKPEDFVLRIVYSYDTAKSLYKKL